MCLLCGGVDSLLAIVFHPAASSTATATVPVFLYFDD